MRFDVEAVRELAGDKVFARGQAYHRNGQVEIVQVDGRRVLAQVEGTEDYRTELTGGGSDIGGQCSCPAFDDSDFCKHMVAVALAANDENGERADDGAVDRIRAHLRAQEIETLIDMIFDFADRDPALFRKLDMAATAAGTDGKAIKTAVRRAIDEATRIRSFIEYRAMPRWSAQVEVVLDSLAALVPGGHAVPALELAEHALKRIEQAIGAVDDSDGYCGGLLYRARDIHIAAARAAGPDPINLAHSLFQREMADDYGIFTGSVALYADALGESGLTEYRRLALEAWDKLPPLIGKSSSQRDFSGGYDDLAAILDFFAERDGDSDARVALRTKDLSSPYRYLKLAEFCHSIGRSEEALRRAQEGLWIFDGRDRDDRLVTYAAMLLSEVGRDGEAYDLLWDAFARAPGFHPYLRFREIAGEGGRTRALEFLEQRLVSAARRDWTFDTEAGLLATILTHERMFDAAWAAIGRYGASSGIKEELAKLTEASHPAEVLRAYAEEVDRLAGAGGNPAYQRAFDLVKRMACLRGAAEQAAYVAELRERHQRKRNFMKLLA